MKKPLPKTRTEVRLEAARKGGPKGKLEIALEKKRGVNPKKGD